MTDKILLVEDEILIQRSLSKMLSMRGKEVTCCSSGREAIGLILENDYDRIICDLMLHDTTGFDVIEESKKKYSLEEISQLFIIITAYNSENVLAKADEYGCQVIGKPFQDIQAALKAMTND